MVEKESTEQVQSTSQVPIDDRLITEVSTDKAPKIKILLTKLPIERVARNQDPLDRDASSNESLRRRYDLSLPEIDGRFQGND